MLKLTNSLLDRGQADAEAGFRQRLREMLDDRHPEFLPRLHPTVADWVLGNMLVRVRAFGATWESNIAKLCDMMETLAPNILQMRQLYARIHPAFRPQHPPGPLAIDRRLRVVEQTLSRADWAAVAAARSDLHLYTPPEQDSQPLEHRTAYALRVTLGDKVTQDTAQAWALHGIKRAVQMGLPQEDAGLVLAAQALLCPDMTREDWRTATVPQSNRLSEVTELTHLRSALLAATGRRV